MTAILWNIDTDDWAAGSMPGITTETVDQNYKNFIDMGKNGTFANSGALILAHEINNGTMDMALKHYPQLKEAYKHIIDVATCMNITNPYVEDTVTFQTFDEYAKTGQAGVKPAGSDSKEGAASSMNSYASGPLFLAVLFAVLTLA